MKGWLLRQPAGSRHSKDITSAGARWAEGDSQCDVSYRERRVNSIANFRQRADGCLVMGSIGSRRHFEETWPVINEQTEDCAGENESASHPPAVVRGEV